MTVARERNRRKCKRWRKANPEREADYKLRRKYGVTLEWFRGQLILQDFKCAICGAEVDGGTAHVDHDHESGAVRELLCTHCNLGLGRFRDRPELMRKAAEYIESHAAHGE